MNNHSAESFLQDGCGRCDKYRTPACKVHLWTDALVALRGLLLEFDLVEEMKWGFPTYTLKGKNVVMLTAFKNHCSLSFFTGAALSDDDRRLVSPGPNSRYMRLMKFTSAQEVAADRLQAAEFIQQAIHVELEGTIIAEASEPEPIPEELEARLDTDTALREAFDSLTPGRQRSHVLHVSGAKASATRERRVEKCVPKILAGMGFNER
jgi:uncharacterized protein YdeI (YjbR/CyaY-like superfamily)